MPIIVRDTKNASPSATLVDSTTVIGLVGTANVSKLSETIIDSLDSNSNVLRYSSASKALIDFSDVEGTVREDLYDINQQNVNTPVIISLVSLFDSYFDNPENTPYNFYGDAEVKTSIILAIGNLQRARTLYGILSKVDIAIAPWFSWDIDVYGALETFCDKTHIAGVADLGLTIVSEAMGVLDKMGSKRVLTCPFNRKDWSIYEDAVISKPNSAIIAGHIAYWDSEERNGEFGAAFDHANRPIHGVNSLEVDLFFQEGDVNCEAEQIVSAGGCILMNDDGWQLFNFETPSADPRFNKLDTTRAFDLLNVSMQKTLKQYKHRPLTDVLEYATATLEVFLGKAVLAGALVGGRVEIGEENNPEDISAGIFYLDYYAGNNVGIRKIVLQPYATNEYYTIAQLTGEIDGN